ncbi:hypothetical protein DFJ77DRAFT_540760 [Powellomyces hirtus]|nr:hypothetical protein DFJ77DRAFT_540760 [Powellomyces hirtus]
MSIPFRFSYGSGSLLGVGGIPGFECDQAQSSAQRNKYSASKKKVCECKPGIDYFLHAKHANKFTKVQPPPYSRDIAGAKSLTAGSEPPDSEDHAVIYERLFALEARLKDTQGELEATKAVLQQTKEEHDKLVASAAKLDKNVGVPLGSDLPQRLSNYDELIYGHGIITGDNLYTIQFRHVSKAMLLMLPHNNKVKIATFGDCSQFPGKVPGFFDHLAMVISRNATIESIEVYGGLVSRTVAKSLERYHLQILILNSCTIEDDVAVALSEAVQKNLGIKALDVSKSKLTLVGRASLSIPRVFFPTPASNPMNWR